MNKPYRTEWCLKGLLGTLVYWKELYRTLPELTWFLPTKTMRFISLWHHFQYGEGFSIHLPPLIIIDIAIIGKLNWWYRFGKLRVYLLGKNIIEL